MWVAGRWWLWPGRVVAVLACLAAAVVLPGGQSGTAGPTPLRVLQLNLCDSGIAPCYTGRSVPQAAAVIRAEAPDLVTVDEVCEPDVPVLAAAMAGAAGAGTVLPVFTPAADRRTGGPFHCLDGQRYGIGLLLRLPPGRPGHQERHGLYPDQDIRDPEERVWTCVDADAGLVACATHLASTSATVALAQCRYLLGTVLPGLRSGDALRPAVLGGDLNLRAGGSPDARSCLPAGYQRRDDGGVQHVVASPEFTVTSAVTLDLAGTTDHPGLLVELRRHAG